MSRPGFGGNSNKQYAFEQGTISIGGGLTNSTTYGYNVATPQQTQANARQDNGVYSLGGTPIKITDSRPEFLTPP